jgi:glycerol kinase
LITAWRPTSPRSTRAPCRALGAAYAAGLTVGFWEGEDDIRANWHVDATWYPRMGEQTRSSYLHSWRKAVERSYGWLEE